MKFLSKLWLVIALLLLAIGPASAQRVINRLEDINNANGLVNAVNGEIPVRSNGRWIRGTGGSITGVVATNAAIIWSGAAARTVYATEAGAAVGVAVTVDWNNGPVQSILMDENVTVTFANTPASGTLTAYYLIFIQDGAGGNVPTPAAGPVYYRNGVVVTTFTDVSTAASAETRVAVESRDGWATATITALKSEIFPVAGTSVLTAAGQVALNTTDKLIGVHNGTREVALPLTQYLSWTFDPNVLGATTLRRLFLMSTDGPHAPKGIKIKKWKFSFDADPATEFAASGLILKRADAFIGVANTATMDDLATTAGVSSESTEANINADAIVATGKVIYLEQAATYATTGKVCIFEMWWEVEED